ncbi:uncharacterized protein LOC134535090 isoform X5 [Bacillus rossius redtenbacheri]|uniref:uncharacterized protein LOC134535090 isoform X5 n=1 Tax=Bacillus rossius redtenbacheri TaxID=93214 RepID=UPI002FDE4733
MRHVDGFRLRPGCRYIAYKTEVVHEAPNPLQQRRQSSHSADSRRSDPPPAGTHSHQAVQPVRHRVAAPPGQSWGSEARRVVPLQEWSGGVDEEESSALQASRGPG